MEKKRRQFDALTGQNVRHVAFSIARASDRVSGAVTLILVIQCLW